MVKLTKMGFSGFEPGPEPNSEPNPGPGAGIHRRPARPGAGPWRRGMEVHAETPVSFSAQTILAPSHTISMPKVISCKLETASVITLEFDTVGNPQGSYIVIRWYNTRKHATLTMLSS